jgi:hypothetical protein
MGPAHSTLKQCGIPNKLWVEAVAKAAYINNFVPTHKIMKTPPINDGQMNSLISLTYESLDAWLMHGYMET